MLLSLKKDDVFVYYVSRIFNIDGIDFLLDKVDEVSTEFILESWRSEVIFFIFVLYIYIFGIIGKNKERIFKEMYLF